MSKAKEYLEQIEAATRQRGTTRVLTESVIEDCVIVVAHKHQADMLNKRISQYAYAISIPEFMSEKFKDNKKPVIFDNDAVCQIIQDIKKDKTSIKLEKYMENHPGHKLILDNDGNLVDIVTPTVENNFPIPSHDEMLRESIVKELIRTRGSSDIGDILIDAKKLFKYIKS